MVSLAAAIDRDRDRRARFLANVRDHIAPLPDLDVRQAELGDLAVCWAQAPGAPQSLAMEVGNLSILFGDAHEGGKCVGAEALLPGWLDAEPSKPVCFDGIHVGLCYDPDRGLAAGVDFLGMLPLWYWSNGETLLLGLMLRLAEQDE